MRPDQKASGSQRKADGDRSAHRGVVKKKKRDRTGFFSQIKKRLNEPRRCRRRRCRASTRARLLVRTSVYDREGGGEGLEVGAAVVVVEGRDTSLVSP